MIRSREVTFACVWTRGDNPAALAAYAGRRIRADRADRAHLAAARLTSRGRDNSRSMTLSRDDVDHVATLARLGLSDAEKSRLLGELEKILDHIARLQQVDTSMLAETAQVGDLVNVMRADEPVSRRSVPWRRCATLRPPTAVTSSSERSRAPSSTPRTHHRARSRAARRQRRRRERLLDDALAHVERTDKDLNAYLSVTRELAEQQADAAARTLEEHPDTASPLCGIPMALKDVLCVDGIETTAASKILQGLQAAVHRHRRAATLRRRRGVRRQDQLRRVRHGIVDRELRVRTRRQPLGRRARAGRQQRRQRRDRRRGHGAVLARQRHRRLDPAAGGAHAAWSGSSRRTGAFRATGSSRSRRRSTRSGPFTRTVEDCALVYAAIAGHDPLRQHLRPACRRRSAARRCARASRACVSASRASISATAPSPACALRSRPRSRVLEAQGATLHEVSLPSTDVALSVYYVIAPAECSSNLARYDGVRFGNRVERPSLTDMYLQTRGAGFRRRGQAAGHARHLRALERLLRRVLPPGAEGAHARRPGVRRRLRARWTRSCVRPRRASRSPWGRATTRSRCTCATS